MPSQAEIITGLNARSDRESKETARPGMGRMSIIVRLALVPSFRFTAEYLSRGGPLGGAAAFRDAVNAWAGAFMTEAKRYELAFADKGKSITESRDFI